MLDYSFLKDPLFLKKYVIIEENIARELERYKDSPYYDSLIYALKGGKRLRPLLLLFSSEFFQEPRKEPYSAAVLVELLHTVSLIHDDIIDKEETRRGVESYYLKFGEEQAILVADFVLGIVLDLALRYTDTEIPHLVSNTVFKMSEGQLLEIRSANKEKISWDEYLRIIEGKTASLFNFATTAGAILSTENSLYIKKISEYGRNLGISYQIYDDLRDWSKKEYVQKLSVSDKESFLKKKLYHHLNLASKSLEDFPHSEAKEALMRFIEIVVKVS